MTQTGLLHFDLDLNWELPKAPGFLSCMHAYIFVSYHYPVPPSAPTLTPCALLLSHTLQLKPHVSQLLLAALPLAVFM